jgi:hypothetical protein
MVDVRAKDSLYNFGISLWNSGGKGILVSGGCDQNGTIPISENILDQIAKLKSETDLMFNMHTGLISKEMVLKIEKSGADRISFDVLGDDSTIREVLKLNKTVQDFLDSYTYLAESNMEIIPHVLAGFHFGEIRGERRAIEIAAGFDPKKVVLIILIPTRGTQMENIPIPKNEEILSIAGYMKERLDGDLILGCMRSKGNFELEKEILKLGFRGIVLPSSRTLAYVNEMGWEAQWLDHCCAL